MRFAIASAARGLRSQKYIAMPMPAIATPLDSAMSISSVDESS